MAEHHLTLSKITVGRFQENCYVLADETSGAALVVDPGAEGERILAAVGGRRVAAILLTHAHGDHIGAVEAVRKATGAPVRIHPAELPQLGKIRADAHFNDGDIVTLGAHQIRAVLTPGHTPGMISLLLDDGNALVGDTIFEGGPGRTWSAADFRTTLATLRDVVLGWPDSTICHPGHGDAFRLGDIRARIEAFLARPHAAKFYGDATW